MDLFSQTRRLFTGAILVVISVATSSADTLHVPGEYESMQSAVDAAEFGDVVLVNAGLYHERIRLKPGIVLRSAGDDTPGELGLKRAEATTIDGNAADADGPGVEMAEGSTLDGFTVTGIGTYDEAEWNRHHTTRGNLQTHEHIGVPGVAGIAINGINRCTIANNIVHHIGYTGIVVMGDKEKSVSPRIIGNVTYRNMGGGIGSMRKSTAIIESNVCFENFYAGIGMDDASPLVFDNRCHENICAGIGISEGSRPIVRGNKCYKNRRAGIGTRTGPETRPIIEDNDCYQNGMAGIGTDEEAAPVIRGNRCYENGMAGIGTQNHSDATIIGNTCYRNKDVGIGTQGGATALIVENECYENEKAGIGQREDAVTTLIGNHVHHNKASGIGFDDCEAGTSTVLNNRVIDNTLVAVGIHSGWTVNLSGNELSRAGGLPPIVMVFQGAKATFTKNKIRGQGVAGIRVAGEVTATRNRFEGITLRKVGPPNFAVWALEGAKVSMSHNQITTWRHALHATGAEVAADHNEVRDFHKTAFVVKNPSSAAHIVDNVAFSGNSDDQVVSIKGEKEGVVRNEVRLLK